jgi:predicted Zn finger-like uncharacterized protein
MDLRCERCRALYVVSDDRVPENGVTVTCARCGHVFRLKKKALVVTVPVRPGESSEAVPIAALGGGTDRPAGTPAPGAWRVRREGSVYPLKELTTLQKWIVERRVGREDEISANGEQWRGLGTIPELAPFFDVVDAAGRAPPASAGGEATEAPRGAAGAAAASDTWSGGPRATASPARHLDEPAWALAGDGALPSPGERAPRAPGPRRGGRVVAWLAVVLAAAVVGAWLYLHLTGTGGAVGSTETPGLPKGGTAEPAPSTPAGPGTAAPSPAPEAARPGKPAPVAGPQAEARTAAAGPPQAPAAGLPAPAAAAPAPGSTAAAGAVEAATPPAKGAAEAVPGAPLGSPAAHPETAPGASAPSASAPAAAEPSAAAPGTPRGAAAPGPEAGPAPPEAAAASAGAPAPAGILPGPAPAAGPSATGAAPAKAPPAAARPAAAPRKVAAAPRAPQAIAKARKLRDRGKYDQALEAYNQALDAEPRNASALAGRGWCYLELSRYASAEASFRFALEADARNPDALFGMAETYRYMGKKGEAVTFYERFLSVQPGGDDAVAARNAIRQLKE